jgi:thioredoxin 1
VSKVIEVTDANFEEEILNSDIPTEVDFWAPWCGPCKMISPVYDKLSEEYPGKFKFCKINVDENQATAMKYQVMSIPMQMFFVDGQKVDEVLGAVPERTVRDVVDRIVREYPSDPEGKLKTILSSWIESNKSYVNKLNKWAASTERGESEPIFYNEALKAGKIMEDAAENLGKVLIEINR